jgi:SNF2 family DNA or RNA helicase
VRACVCVRVCVHVYVWRNNDRGRPTTWTQHTRSALPPHLLTRLSPHSPNPQQEELWALLNFADPVAFGDQASFLQSYGELREAAQVESLHNMLKPFLLRRIKEDVEKSLPPKEETVVEVSLTPLQRKFYMAIYDRNTAFLFKESKPSMAPSLMNVMMELRKCCNHAYLNRGVEERILDEIPVEQRTAETLHKQLVACSGKMVLLDKLLPRLKSEGHKVLIFSQMVRVLDLVEDYMRYQGYAYERLDGSKRASERSAAVVRFNNPALNRFVMLLSTRAGGLGLNLTAADTVIIYDRCVRACVRALADGGGMAYWR